MPSLKTHKQFQEIRFLPFCYLCGTSFIADGKTDGDHIPPETCFAKEDRNVPLKLQTHITCNGNYNLIDDQIGQLIALKWGRVPSVGSKPVKVAVYTAKELQLFAAIVNVDIRGAIWRWVRGFHAALYREPLPNKSQFGIDTPFPTARVSSTDITYVPLRPQHDLFIETLKLNRVDNNIDRIESNNGKMIYECVWIRSDGGAWLCVFTLNLYDWQDLGDIQHFPVRDCTGYYVLPTGAVPLNATQENAYHPLK